MSFRRGTENQLEPLQANLTWSSLYFVSNYSSSCYLLHNTLFSNKVNNSNKKKYKTQASGPQIQQ